MSAATTTPPVPTWTAEPASRITVKIGGVLLTRIVALTIERDLDALAGRFALDVVDDGRLAASFPARPGDPHPTPLPMIQGQKVQIALDGETVLVGWIDAPHVRWTATALSCRLIGRDLTGDLVDCAAAPNGPAEWHGAGLLAIAQGVCAPFAVRARADVDLGAPFTRLAVHPHETVLSCLDKAARQRAVLMTSDGVAGLVFTRGGITRAPAALRMGENVQSGAGDDDWHRRWHDYWVKGQTARAAGRRKGVAPALTHALAPNAVWPTSVPGPATAVEAAGVINTGHAVDPVVTRWRPTVRLARTESGMNTAQIQAEWALRTARGASHGLRYTVLDWRAGPQNLLWRPNQTTAVWDPMAGIDGDMLIAGVAYHWDGHGARTELRVVGRGTYDLLDLPPRPRGPPPGRPAPARVAAPTPIDILSGAPVSQVT